ncbi:MAG: class I SAM-dependent methyltransferase [Actinomycetota bacterium]
MKTPLEDELIGRIRSQGPMPFAAFMSLALYHPRHGYYSRGEQRLGWRGHFLTSPELDPAYAELWAKGFEEIWVATGAPSSFTVVELGPGEGSFAAALLASVGGDFAAALDLALIERSSGAEAQQREVLSEFPRVRWAREIGELDRIEAGCVFANEVLDNLPVHLVENHDGEISEVVVDLEGDRLTTALRPPSNPALTTFLHELGVRLPPGYRYEVGLAARSLIARAAAVLETGVLIFVDYGDTAVELAKRPDGTLVSYSASGVDDRVLERPGEKDITSHANWSSVSEAARAAGWSVTGPRSQRSVLQKLGLDDLHRRLREEHDAAIADKKGAIAMRALSRRQALGALADPEGLGGLGVVTATRAIERPPFMSP